MVGSRLVSVLWLCFVVRVVFDCWGWRLGLIVVVGYLRYS